MSRKNWARLHVSGHHHDREPAITQAIENWQDGACVVRRASTDELILDVTFTLSSGWGLSAAARGMAFELGRANGEPCRVGWTAIWIESGGHCSPAWTGSDVELAADGDRLALLDDVNDERQWLVDLNVSEVSDERVEAADAAIASLLDVHEGSLGVATVEKGQSAHKVVAEWRQTLLDKIGEHSLYAAIWDLDRPDDARLFTPDHFPNRQPERPLQPEDDFHFGAALISRFGLCMFCADHTGLRLVGYWEPPKPADQDDGVVSLHSRRPLTVAVCSACQTALQDRLPDPDQQQRGLFESDGNPSGAINLPPDFRCMTCLARGSEKLVVINDIDTAWACRECIVAAKPLLVS